MTNIKAIDGVKDDTFIERLRALFSKVPSPKPPARKLTNHDQKKNGSCTVFASAGCATYNTGIDWSDDYLTQWAIANKFDIIATLPRVSREFAESHGLNCVQVMINTPEATTLLNSGYALACSFNIPLQALKQGLMTGRIRGKHQGTTMNHAMYVYRIDAHTYVGNSWAELARNNDGYFNKYDIDLNEFLENNYIRGLASLIF